jgi:guanylate kinase
MSTDRKIIIITAPSGAGKTSITRYLLAKYPQLSFSVSAATRSPRSHEKNGIDYYFLSLDEFKHKIQGNEFAEWEMVYEGKYYGTLKEELERIWNAGKTPLLDIEVKGAIHLQEQYPEATLSVFIEPPSVEELRRRLETRGTETAESLRDRTNKASYEMSFKHHFDKIIINSELEKACQEADETIKKFLAL